MPKLYRLALDVGATSIGWTALDLHPSSLDPCGVLRMGVRVFPDGRDPQSGTSLAMDRRLARSARRRRDRFLQRQRRLMAALVRQGLMPAEDSARKALEATDPFALRREALTRALTPYELGRVLWHINRRRGFRSSRKAEGGDGNEKGKIDAGIEALKAEIAAAGAPTLGAWLASRRARGEPVRARLEGVGTKATYPFYPSRALLEAEFAAIRAAQAANHPGLRDADWDRLRGIIFWQRPLKPVDPGRCTLNPGEERMSWAFPLAQRFRIAQEVANLRIVGRDLRKRKLDPEQRRLLRAQLAARADLPFQRVHVLLGLRPDETLNLESDKRDRLDGDATAALMLNGKRFGRLWTGLADADGAEVVRRLLDMESEEDERAVKDWLIERFGLTAEQAAATIAARLPEGHCRLGPTAIAALLPFMEDQGLDYAGAAEAAGYHHSDQRAAEGAGLPRLPLYAEVRELERFLSFGTGDEKDKDPFKRIGRIANPTIHIGLNQIRAVVNDLIEEYGKPHTIVVELSRDLSRSAEDRRKVQREQAENQRNNERRRRQLETLGLPPTTDNVMRLRLWEELPIDGVARRCVYTGEIIGIERLMSPQGDVDIDHILPYSRTLDDSAANRIVCVRRANRAKRNLSPHEAFGDGRVPGYDWDAILEAARKLPGNKRWRFEPEAMSRFDDQQRFLDRHLNDTRYLARLARIYLGGLYDLRRDGERVRAVPGTLIGLLRRRWGLNDLLSEDGEKNRNDHRHHAIDAAIIAVLDKRTLDLVQLAAKRAQDLDLNRLLDDLHPRFNWFREQVEAQVRRIVVSVKPDHGVAGRLHEETNYGLASPGEAAAGHTLVHRKPLDGLSAKEVEGIRDPLLRTALLDHIAAEALNGHDLQAALDSFAKRRDHPWQGVRHVRLLKKEAEFATIAHGPAGRHVRAVVPGDNLCVDIARTDQGRWVGRPVTVLAGKRMATPDDRGDLRLAPPGPDVVMRLHKGDLIRMEITDPAGRSRQEVMRVWRLEVANNRLRLAPHREGGELDKRHADPADPFRWTFASFDVLRRRKARKVTVTPSGRLRDPGPPRDQATPDMAPEDLVKERAGPVA